MRLCLVTAVLASVILAATSNSSAQSGPAAAPAAAAPIPIAGPPPPVAPAVITRDDAGRATLRAIRLTQPLRLDGQLDESLYSSPSISDFIQVEPRSGALATEKTEVWISFDDDNVYVSFRNWESRLDTLVANEMRRDATNIVMGNDNIAFLLDTFYDRRNAMLFETNPLGARMDGQLTNERNSTDFNPIWTVKTGRFDGGWTVEAAVPFKSLRYARTRQQVWGFNARRVNRAKNEVSFITRLSAARGIQATFQVGGAATLVGLEAPARSRNLEVKPYLIGDVATNNTSNPRVVNDVSGDFGIDVKYGVTQNLTADLTYNPDFAQVEVDEQQVNLTRFNLFFPEKREFFLENQGSFAFGGAATGGFQAAGGDTPILFYSRRIGLDRGQAVPLEVGGRLTGRAGRFTLGVLNIHTDEGSDVQTPVGPAAGQPRTNFSVFRLRRDIFRRSNIGLMLTNRSVSQRGPGGNMAYGADATLAFYDNLTINSYWARTETQGISSADTSYRAQLDYAGDRYGIQAEHLAVAPGFNPEVGFLRRSDIRKSLGQFRFSPRPRNNRTVRKYSYTGTGEYIENYAGRVDWRNLAGEFGIEFQTSDQFRVAVTNNYEFVPLPFRIADGVIVPVGGYETSNVQATLQLGQQRKLSGTLTAQRGSFYSGHKTTVGVSRGRLNLSSQVSVEPSYSLNQVDLVEGSFTTHLAGSRVTYTLTPLMFVSALVQYNSGTHSASTNIRLRWEYRPGSELFVVYNDDRNTLTRGFPDLATRAFIVKVNRLLRP
ncbi:MAG TPA: DUF5916 domain-containing protein [Vicinamibacterales bacterium]|jgi:hypothetical protein